MQLVDFKADVAQKEIFERTDHFRTPLIPETAFPGLRKVALYYWTICCPIYNFEAPSSKKNMIIIQ